MIESHNKLPPKQSEENVKVDSLTAVIHIFIWLAGDKMRYVSSLLFVATFVIYHSLYFFQFSDLLYQLEAYFNIIYFSMVTNGERTNVRNAFVIMAK